MMRAEDKQAFAFDRVGAVQVSTTRCGDTFETAVSGGPLSGQKEQYCTEGQARTGHARWVARVLEALRTAFPDMGAPNTGPRDLRPLSRAARDFHMPVTSLIQRAKAADALVTLRFGPRDRVFVDVDRLFPHQEPDRFDAVMQTALHHYAEAWKADENPSARSAAASKEPSS